MEDCLFCKIIAGNIPSTKVWEDDVCYAFRDINPQARIHIVLVPKTHVCCLNGLEGLTDQEISHLLRVIPQIAAQEGIAQSGYRIVSNCGSDACQSVKHLHIHILGGEQLADKMA